MRRDLNLNATDAALGLSVYAWGFAWAPLILAPFSEECKSHAAFHDNLSTLNGCCLQGEETPCT